MAAQVTLDTGVLVAIILGTFFGAVLIFLLFVRYRIRKHDDTEEDLIPKLKDF